MGRMHRGQISWQRVAKTTRNHATLLDNYCYRSSFSSSERTTQFTIFTATSEMPCRMALYTCMQLVLSKLSRLQLHKRGTELPAVALGSIVRSTCVSAVSQGAFHCH